MRTVSSHTLLYAATILLVGAGIPALLWVPSVRHAAAGATLPFLHAKVAVEERVQALADRLVPLDGSERARLRYLERLVAQLHQQVRNAQNAQEENRELRLYQDLAPTTSWRLVVAPIIARDPVSWNRAFRIGKGARHGIVAGAAVMAGNQVLGRVEEVTPNSALVLTLADPACRLSVRLPSANAVGILTGREEQAWHAPPICRITALPRDNDYRDNEAVVTSGLGETAPGGLPVGRVVPWEDRTVVRVVDTAYAELLVQPGAQYNVFSNVGVVVPRVAPAPPAAAAAPTGETAPRRLATPPPAPAPAPSRPAPAPVRTRR